MEFREFILAHDGCDIPSLALQRERLARDVEDWDLALSTLESRRKIKSKLPSWYALSQLRYPLPLSAEQCSGEETAIYKASLVSLWFSAPKADELAVADFTGGMGVDTWAFSKVASRVLYNEMNPELAKAAEYNFRELGVNNVMVKNHKLTPGSVKAILDGFKPDVIFLDPARRSDTGRKVFMLEDCSPNVPELLPELLDICPRVMLKLSPMADITLVCKQLPGVREVHVVAAGGECKELLLLLEKGHTGSYTTVIYESGSTLVYGDGGHRFVDITTISCGLYIFEPGKALMKSGAFELPCEHGLTKLGIHTHLYVSQEPVPEELAPFGKCFEIVEVFPLSGKTMKEAGKKYPRADVSARNIPMTSDDLRKRLGVKPSDGSLHIFGVQSDADGRLLIIARATEREAPVPPRSERTSA